ncbi:hypothetical protein DB346_15280 [Verrucomicrobia bacterium LW23]|nr:hypothetical protein DB346_15280 [Verrucomicrobia bacterium LW23]
MSGNPEPTTPVATQQAATYKASDREIYIWGTSQITNGLIGTLGTNITVFFNTTLGLDAALIGIATLIPRILDAITDPLMGHISDNTHTRWGRRRPYILIGSILTAITMAGMWWASPGWSQPALFAWLAIGLLTFGVANTIIQVPLEALGLELTDDYHQRTKIQSVKFFFGAVLGLGIPWIYWLTLRPEWGGEVYGFRGVYFVIAILIVVFGLLPAIFCQERFQRSNEKPESIYEGIKTAWQNKYFRQIVYLRLTNAIAATITAGMYVYINIYYICQGDKVLAMELAGIGGTMYSVMTFAFLFCIPWLGRTLGKRTSMLIGFGLQVAGMMLNPWLQTPENPYLQLVGTALAVPAGLMANIFVSSFMADVCDLGEVQSGRRMEGTYGAVFGFLSKIEYSLLAVVVGFLVSFSGFNPALPQQPVDIQNNIRWLTYIPGFFFICLTFWFAWRFEVDHKLMQEARATLDARHRAKADKASEAD